MWAKGKPTAGQDNSLYRHRNRYASKPEIKEPLVAINDEEEEIFMDGEGNLSPSNQQKLKRLQNGQVVRVAVPMPVNPAQKKKKQRAKMIVSLVGAVIVLGAVVFGIVWAAAPLWIRQPPPERCLHAQPSPSKRADDPVSSPVLPELPAVGPIAPGFSVPHVRF